jgi:hypothetical protein
LTGCTFDTTRLIPRFNLAPKAKVAHIEPIKWDILSHQDFPYLMAANECSLLYIKMTFCYECDRVDDKIFANYKFVETIKNSFVTFKVTNDDEDFESFVKMWRPPIKDVPIVVIVHNKKTYMWEVDDGLEKLAAMINTASTFKECKIAVHN